MATGEQLHMSDEPMENKPEETETNVARAIEVILDAMQKLENRQDALQEGLDNLTGCFRETLKSLKILARAVAVHDKALDIQFPEPPAPSKVN
jgi:hypothetical protein